MPSIINARPGGRLPVKSMAFFHADGFRLLPPLSHGRGEGRLRVTKCVTPCMIDEQQQYEDSCKAQIFLAPEHLAHRSHRDFAGRQL